MVTVDHVYIGPGAGLPQEKPKNLLFHFGNTEDAQDLSLRVSYEDISGASVNATLKDQTIYDANRNLYTFTFDELLAAELRTVVSVQIFEGDRPLSCTLRYSADSYGNNHTGTLLNLCKALFAYVDSAKDYFV